MGNPDTKTDLKIGIKRTSRVAKNEDLNVVQSKCPKKDRKLESLSKSQLIQKCNELETMIHELEKFKDSSEKKIAFLENEMKKSKIQM